MNNKDKNQKSQSRRAFVQKTAIASGILMVVLSAWVVSKPTEQASWVLFKFSSPYLAVLFIALMVDSAL